MTAKMRILALKLLEIQKKNPESLKNLGVHVKMAKKGVS